MSQTTPASTLEHLSRLAARPGVQSTLILSQADGAVIQSTGLISDAETSARVHEETSANGPFERPEDSGLGTNGEDQVVKGNSVDEVAKMVFSFVTAARAFADGLHTSDEVRLLRMRTRKHEIVIVPDTKFLLVLIHDAPSM